MQKMKANKDVNQKKETTAQPDDEREAIDMSDVRKQQNKEEEEANFRISQFMDFTNDTIDENDDEAAATTTMDTEEDSNLTFEERIAKHERLLSFAFPLSAHHFLEQVDDMKLSKKSMPTETEINDYLVNPSRGYGIRGHMFYTTQQATLKGQRERTQLKNQLKLKGYMNAAKKLSKEKNLDAASAFEKRKKLMKRRR